MSYFLYFILAWPVCVWVDNIAYLYVHKTVQVHACIYVHKTLAKLIFKCDYNTIRIASTYS